MDLRIGSLAALALLAGCSAGEVRSTAAGIQQWAANGAANREAERWGPAQPADDFRVPGGAAPAKAAEPADSKDQGGAGAGPSSESASSAPTAAAPSAPPPVIILR